MDIALETILRPVTSVVVLKADYWACSIFEISTEPPPVDAVALKISCGCTGEEGSRRTFTSELFICGSFCRDEVAGFACESAEACMSSL